MTSWAQEISMTVDNTIKMQEQLQAPRRPRTCLAWYPTNCRCQVKSTKNSTSTNSCLPRGAPGGSCFMAFSNWWRYPCAEHWMCRRWAVPSHGNCREIAIAAHLLSTSKFTAHLPAAFLTRDKQHPLLWADPCIYSGPQGSSISSAKGNERRFVLLFPTLYNFKTTEVNEGKVDGKMGVEIPSSWLLLLTTGFSLYSGPSSCEQKQRRVLSPRRPRPTWREATLAIQRQNYLSGKHSVRHTYVHSSHKHTGPHVSISTPQPYRHCLLLPGGGSIITPRMSAHGRGENPREHRVNNKSQHKKQLRSVNSGLSFMKQKGREEISRSLSSFLLLERIYYPVI